MIAAFRLLAAKLQSRHPILLKDVLTVILRQMRSEVTNDESQFGC